MTRLVLDTNVVLDLVVFEDAGVRALRGAIERAEVAVYTSTECLDELQRVLAYPKIARQDAFARYAAWAQCVPLPAAAADPRLPRCADPDDQKFLALALAVGAELLLTRDKALLALAARARRHCGFDIRAPQPVGKDA